MALHNFINPIILFRIPITYNKKHIPLLNLLNNCISAKSVLQILPIKDECTSRFSNLLNNSLLSETMPEIIPVLLFALQANLSRFDKNL